tara:strand:+ start:462 stop:977 length:516 start_codon:yes stop_codon:yes gene_type:complete
MQYQEFSQERQEPEFFMAQKVAREIYDYMRTPEVAAKLLSTHQVNAQSREIQEIILPKCQDLGMSSEKKGLFASYATAQLRPDYYIPLNESGLIMEVERGKTTTNNMDLLDVWKCHICEKADYLLLVVPVIRQTNNGGRTKIFDHVVKRISSFFEKQNYVNVKGCFIIGYE